MKALTCLALAASLISARPPIPRDEPALAYNAIALIECGDYSGTAFWAGRDRIITAYHVAGERTCEIDGVTLTRVRADAAADIAEYTGLPSRATVRVDCRAPRAGAVYWGVGWAFGSLRHTARLTATGDRDDGAREPIARGMVAHHGAVYPGMSGGPVFDRQGRAVSMINRGTRVEPMMMQGRALADTFLCQR